MTNQPTQKAQAPLDEALALWWRLAKAEGQPERGPGRTDRGESSGCDRPEDSAT
jgi:hypothetical protein